MVENRGVTDAAIYDSGKTVHASSCILETLGGLVGSYDVKSSPKECMKVFPRP